MSKKYISEMYVESVPLHENIFQKVVRDYREMRDDLRKTNKASVETLNTFRTVAGITFAYLVIKKIKDK